MCALHWAAKLGQIDVLRLLLLRIDVDEPDEDDRTALFHAIDNDTEMPEVIDFLLEHGADASHRDNRATSALRLATEKGRVNTMRKLVKLDGTALLEAVQRCSEYDDAQSVTVKAVKALLDCGADINVRSEYSHDNVLHIAARTGCFAVFDLLQGSSQLIEETNTDGRTPLHVAADNSESIVRALVEQHSANIKAKTNENWTPLHFSARQSNTDLVSFLMDKGADLTARTDEGFTPAYFACLCQHDEVAATILERIIQEHTLSATGVGEDQGPLLMCAIIYGCFHVVKRLVQYATESGTNGKLSSEITPGWTPVLVALAMTRSDIANLLIENGASTEGSTPDGNTALHWASVNGMTEVVVGLLESHAGGDRLLTMPNNQGMVPLDCAAAGQHTDVVCLLLKRSDPQREIETPTDGWTALHWAAWYQRLDVIKCLIHNLADLSERDASNRTAFDIAKGLSTSSSEILKWLTLNNVHNAHISNPPLEKPVPEDTARDFCKQTSIYLMDVYPEAVMEKAGFTVFDVIYEWGPSPFMKMVANAQKIKGDLGFRWIHLPVNRKIWIKVWISTKFGSRANLD
ncbi:ankyrin repeat-containing domain protein [Xylaria intraflava]|nr:ankyrin repeat-containing domain protein [Xylaria intraflava]